LKHFKLVGQKTTREFDIDDDEMVMMKVVKTEDYEKKVPHRFMPNIEMQNIIIYDTKEIEN